jgi:hypothetical protein
MARKALTDRFITGVRPAKRSVFFDSKAKGLALRITPAGVKTWSFVYRHGGKPQWLTLGSYPAVTLADARSLALVNDTRLTSRSVIRRRSYARSARRRRSRRRQHRSRTNCRIWLRYTSSLRKAGREPGKTTSTRRRNT